MTDQKPKAPTDEFMRAVCNGGSPTAQCELCGRLNFVGHAMNENSYEQEEVDDNLAKAADFPDKYHEQDGEIDCILHGRVDGKEAVWGCPCNIASRYETWLWAHRWLIADYFGNVAGRLESQKKEAVRAKAATMKALEADS